MRCATLSESEATFDFMVQFQTDPDRMPIEDASVEWTEQDSPYAWWRAFRIPPQSFDDPLRARQVRARGVQPVALPAGASAARRHEPRTAGDLRRDGRIPK